MAAAFVLLLPPCLAAVSLLRHLAVHPMPDRGFAEISGGKGQGGAGGGGGEVEAGTLVCVSLVSPA